MEKKVTQMFKSEAGTLFTNLVRMESRVSFDGKEGHTNVQIRSWYSIYQPCTNGKLSELSQKRRSHKSSNLGIRGVQTQNPVVSRQTSYVPTTLPKITQVASCKFFLSLLNRNKVIIWATTKPAFHGRQK